MTRVIPSVTLRFAIDEVGAGSRNVGGLWQGGPKVEMEEAMGQLNMEPVLMAALRSDLLAADWTVDVVEGLLSPMALAAMDRDQLVPAALEMRNQTSPAAVLTMVFVLAQPVRAGSFAYAMPTLGVDGAVSLGVIATEGRDGEVWCNAVLDLRPHTAAIPVGGVMQRHQWWVASDLSQAQTGRPPREDYVLGIASASTNLLRLTMRDPVASALDMGCGCGILALYLSIHAQKVVATDISERACDFTRFNAALNKVDIDVRQGSLFDPVVGQSFDLITSNPPFVITPEAVRARTNLEYRDGGMVRDNLIPLIIEQAVAHLTPGGCLQMLANWEVGSDTKWWQRRPTRWVEDATATLVADGVEVDAWVVQRDLVDVAQYAEWWMRDQWGDNVERGVWNAEYAEWIRDFAKAGTGYVGLGFIAVRLRSSEDDVEMSSGGLTVVAEYLPEGEPADGNAVKTALNNLRTPRDWKHAIFLRRRDVREARYYVPGQPDPELVRITQGCPGGRDRSVSSVVAALVGVSDGELTPAQVIPAIAALLGREESEVSLELEEAVPELLRSGVLEEAPSPEH